jgi:hypothetical protein
MSTRLRVIVVAALLVASSAATAADLNIPNKGAPKVARPSTIPPVQRAHKAQPEKGASNCTLMPLCLLFGGSS